MAAIAPSASYSVTARVSITNRPGMLGRVAMAIGEAGGDIGAVDLFARALEVSKSEARTKITQGGAYVNNVRGPDVKHRITLEHFAEQRLLLVRGGKKDYRLVRAV